MDADDGRPGRTGDDGRGDRIEDDERPNRTAGHGHDQNDRRSTPTSTAGRRRFLAALSAGSVAGVAGCSDREFRTDADGPPRLHVEGRWVRDPEGYPVVLRGVSLVDPVWSDEHADERGKGYWETLRLATDADRGWHPSVVRIPVEPASIRSVGLDTVVEQYLDRAIELAAERGVYALIDYHANERYDTASIDRRLRAFWDRVAPRYADESHVLYELFSEPTEPAAGGIDAWRTWRAHAEPWTSLVREHAPETPIVVGSPAWSSMTAHAAREPFAQENLLYSAHVYPSWDPRVWEPAFGTPALDVPVFVTEWGYANVEGGAADHAVGTTSGWGQPFREWVDAHTNVHWCATTFDAGRQPAMFDADWTLLGGDDHMGDLVRDWLAARRDDHRPGAPTYVPYGAGSAPSPPTDLAVTRVDETSATVQWEAAGDPNGDGILQYRIGVDDREPTVLRGVERSTELRGLDPERTYQVHATAVDARGLESEPATARFRTHARGDPAATLPLAPSAPTVDGTVDDAWGIADPREVGLFLWGDRPLGVAAQWRAAWDRETLYALVEVSESEDARETAVELYFDLDHSRDPSYDGENDLQLIVERGGETAYAGANSAPVAGGTRVGSTVTDDGWRMELSLPWAEYDVRPIVGHRIGMDVQVLVGDREGKIGWFDASDGAWEDPRQFATVELGE